MVIRYEKERTMPKPKRYKQFRALPPEALRCHTFSHSWDDLTDQIGDDRGPRKILRGRYIILICTSCDTERREVWSEVTGRLVSREYRYHDWYRAGETPKSALTRKEMLRVEYLSRKK